MTSAKFLDFFSPPPPCPHLELICSMKFTHPPLLLWGAELLEIGSLISRRSFALPAGAVSRNLLPRILLPIVYRTLYLASIASVVEGSEERVRSCYQR